MFKKVILTSLISTIVFFSITLISTNANSAQEHITKAVYFVPKNRPVQKHIPKTLSE